MEDTKFVRDFEIGFLDGEENRKIVPGEARRFSFRAPFRMQVETIVFGVDCDVEEMFVGAQNMFSAADMVVHVADLPGSRVSFVAMLHPGQGINLKVSVDRECEFSARVIGKRESRRVRGKASGNPATSTRLGGRLSSFGAFPLRGMVAPGEVRAFTVRPQTIFRGERLVVDDPESFCLVDAEVARDSQIEGERMFARNNDLPLCSACPGEEVRLLVKCIAPEAREFRGRLYGESLLS